MRTTTDESHMTRMKTRSKENQRKKLKMSVDDMTWTRMRIFRTRTSKL